MDVALVFEYEIISFFCSSFLGCVAYGIGIGINGHFEYVAVSLGMFATWHSFSSLVVVTVD